MEEPNGIISLSLMDLNSFYLQNRLTRTLRIDKRSRPPRPTGEQLVVCAHLLIVKKSQYLVNLLLEENNRPMELQTLCLVNVALKIVTNAESRN